MDHEGRYTIDELVDLTGCSRRTIRFYVERGLLAPPAGRGRGGFYAESQLARLREIVAAREEGRSLASLARQFGPAGAPEPSSPEASSTEAPPALPAGLPSPARRLRWTLAPGIVLDVEEESLAGSEELLRRLLALASGRAEQGE